MCVSKTQISLEWGSWITLPYMDSMRPHRPITPYVITQLMQLFASKVDEDGKLKVKIIPSTAQHNADDCGVYAAAYAREVLLNGVHGVQAPFSVVEMRPHLVACLEEQCLAPFLREENKRWGKRQKIVTLATWVSMSVDDAEAADLL